MRSRFKSRSATAGRDKPARTPKKMTPINYGLFLLSRRDYGIAELQQKFSNHYAGDETAVDACEAAVERFIELKYLDDQRFATGYMRREVARGQGPIKVRWALRRKQIAESLIDELFETVDWFAACFTVYESRHHLYLDDLPRMTRFLAGRGFSPDQIQYSLNESSESD